MGPLEGCYSDKVAKLKMSCRSSKASSSTSAELENS